MTDIVTGIVLRCIGGFYYVEAADAVYECRARGIFRRQGLTPVAGDHVRISRQASFQDSRDDGLKGMLEEVLERRNVLVRPPVANLDILGVVASITEPEPSTQILDRQIAIAERKGIEPVLLINKADLQQTDWLEEIYRKAGLVCFVVSASTGEGIGALREYLRGKVCALTGNSGVGKSSLLNAIDPRLLLETGEISKKLGRGRHTTRTASLFPLEGGGYLVDTPGFSSLTVDLERMEWVPKEELPDCFREFRPYLGQCRFSSCAHVHEPGCAVRHAVEEGWIASSRYESYVDMYNEVKDKKEWEQGGKSNAWRGV